MRNKGRRKSYGRKHGGRRLSTYTIARGGGRL